MEKNISKVPTLIEEEKSSEEKDIKVLNKQGKKKRKGVVKFFLAVFLLSLLIVLHNGKLEECQFKYFSTLSSNTVAELLAC